MWGLLQWLFDRYWDVIDWFGNRYRAAVNLLNNFWTWIEGKAVHYYNLAKAWALPKINAVASSAWAWVEAAKSNAWGWVENAKSWAWGIVENAKGYAWNLVEAAKGYAYGLVNWLNGVASNARDWLRSHLEGLINAAKTTVMNWARAAVDMVPSLRDLLTALGGTTLGRIVSLVTTGWSTLDVFLSDPLGFVIAYVKSVFVTLLCYSVAYGLGTVEADLPPWPTFGSGGNAPPGGGTWPPPPGAGKLGQPVVPLYISGYTFGPGHHAVDFGLVNGQQVFATHDGVIETVASNPTGYGNYMTVRGAHWWTLYAHLQGAVVSTGQSVATGQEIARGDDTGMSTGPHLHFVCKFNGEFVDPVLAIG